MTRSYSHQIHSEILERESKKNALHKNFSTGHIVGELLQALKLPIEYLSDEASVIMRDWIFKKECQWRNNKAFKKGVSEENKNNRAKKVEDSNLSKYFIFMMSLRKAACDCTEKSKSFEDISDADIEELCSSANTLKSEDFSQIS